MSAVRRLFILLLAALAVIEEVTSASYGGAYGGANEVEASTRPVSHPTGPNIVSPCPEILLIVSNNNKTNRWYGVISFPVEEPINGIDLSIRLDKRAELLGTWLGEVFTDDKTYFSVIDDQAKVLPGEVFTVRFFVKYDPSEGEPPNVKTITFNGRQMCPLNKESLDLRDSAESDSSPLISSETTQSVAVDHGSTLPHRITSPEIETTLSPRHSHPDVPSLQEKIQDHTQAASMLVNLLRRLARIRNAPDDQSLFDEVHEGSFGSRRGTSGVPRRETLEGLLTTLLSLLTTDEERPLDLGIPNARYDVEPERVDGERTTPTNAEWAAPPEAKDRSIPVRTAVNLETNRVSYKGEDVGVGRPFKTKDPETNYDETEYGDDALALFVSTPKDAPLKSSESLEAQVQTTTAPTTIPEDPSLASSEFGTSLGERNFEFQDTESFGTTEVTRDGVETTTVTTVETDRPTTLLVSDPTETTLLSETQTPTTSEPTTVDWGADFAFSQRKAIKVEVIGSEEEAETPIMTTPCPGVFSYFHHLAGHDVWYGNITLKSDEDLIGLRVDLELDKRAQGLGVLLGNVTTRDNIHFTVWNATATIDPGESIYVYFFVKYDPEDAVPPKIQTIRLNGMQICSTKEAEAPPPSSTTSSTVLPVVGKRRPLPNERITFKNTANIQQYEQLYRTTRPSTTDFSNEKYWEERSSDTYRSQQQGHTTRITTTEPVVAATEPVTPPVRVSFTSEEYRPPFNADTTFETTVNIVPTDAPTTNAERKNSVEEDSEFIQRPLHPVNSPTTSTTEQGTFEDDGATCGQKGIESSNTRKQGKAREWWPWQAAIYEIRDDNLYYICGGTIVGKRTILTAARCLSDGENKDVFNPKSLAVYVGKYDLNRWDEAVQYREVEEVHVHPDFDWKNIHGDLAVFKLSRPIEFSSFVQPVCLGKEAEQGSEKEEGLVVGWGFDRHGNVSDELTTTKMPLLTMRTCSSRYPKLLNYALSDRIYCAGYRSRTTICSGEMGDGMYFAAANTEDHPSDTEGRGAASPTWTIRGIASFTLSRKSGLGCSDRNYVVFTDVTKYLDWIGKYR